MAFKRIVGVLAVRNSRLVKSYGYAAWRPAGGLRPALKNLDRWGADEILVLDISRRPGLDPAVLSEIKAARVSTPLAYGGGIRCPDHLTSLMELGCDRFVVETALFSEPDIVSRLADLVGCQALIGSLPVRLGAGGIERWSEDSWHPLGPDLPRLLDLPVSEYLVTAAEAEGNAGTFPPGLVSAFSEFPPGSIIWFGGLDASLAMECLGSPQTAAVAWGNPNHETELALPQWRTRIRAASMPVRPVRLT